MSLLIEKLNEYGISKDVVTKCHLTLEKSINATTGSGPDAMAIKIPYFNINGEETTFARYRLLKSNKGPFDNIRFKYYQHKNTGVDAYLPPLVDWSAIAEDVEAPIIITEGEFKAIATTAAGYPCIGLGGVSSFQSKASQQVLIPTLTQFMWAYRKVYIVYDSDLLNNPQVKMAQMRLAKILENMSALVHIGFVEARGLEKMGLDDAILTHGPTVVEDILRKAVRFSSYEEIASVSDRYVYVAEQSQVYDRQAGVYIPTSGFHDLMAPYKCFRHVMNTKGDVVYKEVQLSKEWMSSHLRVTVQKETFDPSTTETFIHDAAYRYPLYNTFTGLGSKPADVTDGYKTKAANMFIRLLQFLFRDTGWKEMHDFICWIAEGLRTPSLRPQNAIIMWSHMEGNGKSTVAEVIKRLYGDKWSSNVTSALIKSQYNNFFSGKLFVTCDELTGEDIENVKETRAYMDQLKNLITQDTVVVSEKYMRNRTEKNYARYFFTSNNASMIHINNMSRRFFIIHAVEDRLEPEFYRDFYTHVMTQAGIDEIHAFLLEYIGDSPDEVINNHAPMTAATQELIDNSKSHAEMWVANMKEAAERVETHEASGLAIGHIVPEVVTLSDFADMYNEALGTSMRLHHMQRFVMRQRISIFPRRISIKRRQNTVIILANPRKWSQASDDKVQEYIRNWQSYRYEP